MAEEVKLPAGGKNTPGAKKKNRKKGKIVGRILVILVILAVIAGAFFALKKYVFTEEPKEILRDTAFIGSISNKIEGYGYTRALHSATVVPGGNTKVLEVNVMEGDWVEAGEPLFTLDSSDVQKTVSDADKVVQDYLEQIAELQEQYADLTVRPPFNGKLTDTVTLLPGNSAGEGTALATLVDDTKMKLQLYFSYAYENAIAAGSAATVSIPIAMGQVKGKVEEIQKVRFITPEGTVCFRAVIVLDNPGSLSKGMTASAVLKAADGTDIYPYDGGTLEYYREQQILTKSSGEVLQVNLMNYADVTTDTVLLQLSPKTLDTQMAGLQRSLREAQAALETARETLDKYHGTAPISGMILSCPLVAGENAQENSTITIADTSVMVVDIDVDERNISYVTTGMTVDLTDWDGVQYVGTITDVSLTGKMENGAATFPVTVEVDNADGFIKSNMSMNFSFQASQADNCLLVPVQSVKNTTDENGEPITVVFLEAAERPENAVSVPMEAGEAPTEEEGFYAVPVELGISDVYNVEIVSGLQEGDTVFTSYMKQEEELYY